MVASGCTHDDQASVVSRYDEQIAQLSSPARTLATRLEQLNALAQDLEADPRVPAGRKRRMADRLGELRGRLECDIHMHRRLVAAATAGLSATTSVDELQARLAELDDHCRLVDASSNLAGPARERLKRDIARARAVLTALRDMHG